MTWLLESVIGVQRLLRNFEMDTTKIEETHVKQETNDSAQLVQYASNKADVATSAPKPITNSRKPKPKPTYEYVINDMDSDEFDHPPIIGNEGRTSRSSRTKVKEQG